MGVVRLLVAKDLRRRARSPLGLLIVLSFPIVFSLLIALSFGGHGERIPKIKLLVENLDDEPAGNAILSALTGKQMAEYVDAEVVGPEGMARIEKGEASALLRIPKGLTRDVIDGKPVTLALVRNPAQGILPEIAEQMLRVLADVCDAGVHVLRRPLDELAPFTRKGAIRITDESVIGIALAVKRTVESSERFLDGPALALRTTTPSRSSDEEKKDGPSPVSAIFLFVLPGVSVYALFLVADLTMRDLIAEGSAGTLRRQLAGPIRASTLVAAKAVSAAVLCGIALLVLAAVGAVVLRGGVDPLGFVLLSAALVLAVTGTSAALYGFARNEQRGSTITGIVYLVLAFAGGSFVSLDAMPPVMRSIAPVSPFYWGTEGFKKLLQGGAAVDVLPHVGVLAGLGIVLLFVGAVLLHRGVRKGSFA
jgi:ABC-2 type transport system permease protein